MMLLTLSPLHLDGGIQISNTIQKHGSVPQTEGWAFPSEIGGSFGQMIWATNFEETFLVNVQDFHLLWIVARETSTPMTTSRFLSKTRGSKFWKFRVSQWFDLNLNPFNTSEAFEVVCLYLICFAWGRKVYPPTN